MVKRKIPIRSGHQSFTEKEWDEFLSKFDSLEDAIRKLMEEEQEKRAAEELGKEKETSVEEDIHGKSIHGKRVPDGR